MAAGDIEEGQLVEVNVAGVGLVRCDAGEGAELGGTLSLVSFRADSGGQVPGGPFLVTTLASNPGEVRATTANQSATLQLGANRLSGLASNTPQSWDDWYGPLWTADRVNNWRTISTNQQRVMQRHIGVPSKPDLLNIYLRDDVAASLTVEIYVRDYEAQYPAIPDIVQASLGDGTLQRLTIDTSGLSFTPGIGRIFHVTITTKGGGGANKSYELRDAWFIFPS